MTATPDTTNTPLGDLVQVLADRRGALAALKLELRNHQAAFDAEHHSLVAGIALLTGATDQATEQVRQVALAVYTTTGEREPAPGVEVYQKRIYQYDPKALLEWARTANRLFITETLNVKVVEAAIGSGAEIPVPGTALAVEPAVRIATDLQKVLVRREDVSGGAA